MLEFTYHPFYEDNRIWACHQVKATLNGQEIGYLKMAYVDPKLVKERCPTVWHFQRMISGWGIDPDDPKSIYKYMNRCGSTPPPEDPKSLRDELKRMDKAGDVSKKMKKWLKEMNYAYVEYIKVHDDYRGNGYAMHIYREGARWLKQEFGWDLNSSTLQQDEAKRVWEKMVERGPDFGFPIVRAKDPSKQERWRFQFTGEEDTLSLPAIPACPKSQFSLQLPRN